jgi:serine/threonine protein kinase
MPFDEILGFFMDITDGLHYLHSHGFIHRDVKPSNCLLHLDGNGKRPRVLLSDFGEVQVTNSTRTGSGATGTVSYCAPEVLRQDGAGAFGNFTVKSDIFSVGMIVFFLCFARLPYTHADDANEEDEDLDLLREEILAWAGFDDQDRRGRTDLPNRMYSFLKRLLAVDPDERPTTDEILASLRLSDEDDPNDRSRISPIESPHPRRSFVSNPPDLRPNRPPSPIKQFDKRVERVNMMDVDTMGKMDTMDADTSDADTIDADTIDTMGTRQAIVRANRSRPLALPAPRHSTFYSLRNSIRWPFLLKLILFALKFVSLSYPCRPFGLKNWIALPLILIAASDMSPLEDFFLSKALVLATIHAAVLLLGPPDTVCEVWHPVMTL